MASAGSGTAQRALLFCLLGTLPSLACGNANGGSATNASSASPSEPLGSSDAAAAQALEPSWPAGTVLAVNDEPISAEEVDRVAGDIAFLYPQYSEPHLRRLALTNVFLPRAAVISRHRERAAVQLERCREVAETLSSGSEASTELVDAEGGITMRELRGDFRELGLETWALARHLEPKRWSAPLPLTGRFGLVRLAGTPEGRPPNEILTLHILEFAYISARDEASETDAALDASKLHVVDPAWGRLVPERWKYRMRGNNP